PAVEKKNQKPVLQPGLDVDFMQ
ncbi:unnamed protein product, partial [Allacma fusca]